MRLIVMPGDGIGPEIIAAAVDVMTAADKRYGLGLNYDYEDTGEPKWIGGASDGYLAISAGTVDDNADKVIALRDGGGFGWIDDKLDTLQLSETSVTKLGTASVSSESRDVELADLDMDGRAEIALLQNEAEVQLRRPVSASSHTVMVTRTLSVTDAPLRIGSRPNGFRPIGTLDEVRVGRNKLGRSRFGRNRFVRNRPNPSNLIALSSLQTLRAGAEARNLVS